MIDIRSIDLNLLTILEALLRLRNVSQAAKAVGLTQSATSSALGRLRLLFDDQLLLRSGNKMILTERAELLRGPVGAAYEHLRSVFAAEPLFDARTSERTLTLIATDYVQLVMLRQVCAGIARAAPGINLIVRPPTGDIPIDQMEGGEVDLVFAPFDVDLPNLFRKRIFEDSHVGLLRKGHPLKKKKLDMGDICSLGHIMVSFRGETHSNVDTVLKQHGKRRVVKIAVPNFSMALHLVGDSDHLMIAPRRLAEQITPDMGLQIVELGVHFPGFKIYMFWHGRTADSSAHQWLRQQVLSIS